MNRSMTLGFALSLVTTMSSSAMAMQEGPVFGNQPDRVVREDGGLPTSRMKGGRLAGASGKRAALKAKLLAKYDLNGNGAIDPEERERAKDDLKNAREKRREEGGARDGAPLGKGLKGRGAERFGQRGEEGSKPLRRGRGRLGSERSADWQSNGDSQGDPDAVRTSVVRKSVRITTHTRDGGPAGARGLEIRRRMIDLKPCAPVASARVVRRGAGAAREGKPRLRSWLPPRFGYSLSLQ